MVSEGNHPRRLVLCQDIPDLLISRLHHLFMLQGLVVHPSLIRPLNLGKSQAPRPVGLCRHQHVKGHNRHKKPGNRPQKAPVSRLLQGMQKA